MGVWYLWKIRSTENTVHIDRKIRPFDCKIIYTLILPSMNFQKTHPKRERESERELKHTPPEVIPKHIIVGQITVLIPSTQTHSLEDRERAIRESEEDNPTQPSPVLDPPIDLVVVTSFRPTHLSRYYQTHVTDLPFFSLPTSSKPLQDERSTVT